MNEKYMFEGEPEKAVMPQYSGCLSGVIMAYGSAIGYSVAAFLAFLAGAAAAGERGIGIGIACGLTACRLGWEALFAKIVRSVYDSPKSQEDI